MLSGLLEPCYEFNRVPLNDPASDFEAKNDRAGVRLQHLNSDV